uniref:Uncharacterized protein n=1 Tax=Candidatus Kentrum sp. LFY TaxID=2126342 RepID=A0A450W8M8_9GAMM|nr:MAG: hypothetical protein BECKLFY1418C_GA0070996_100333 [Candidatus Kentron sp. LFY]
MADDNLKDAMEISKRKISEGKEMPSIVPKREFSKEYFTKRESRLLEKFGREYAGSRVQEMVEATHLESSPWHEAYEVGGLRQQAIPYELALKKSEYGQLMKNVIDNKEFEENYA